MMKNIYLLTLLLSLSTLSCAKKDDTQDPNVALRALAQADRDSIPNSITGFNDLSLNMQQSIGVFFGGSTGPAFQKFLDDRIRFFITQDEYESIEDNSFHGRLGKSSGGNAKTNEELKDSKVKVAATNIGVVLWLISAIEDVKELHFSFRSNPLVLDSPRVGLMLIGEGYNMSYLEKDGTTYNFPAAYRQSVLFHEARHSDCPTGLNRNDLDFVKSKKNLRELTESFKKMSCGQLHSYCPESHKYKNLPACDRMAWGAYSAGAMFAALSIKSAANSKDRRVMELVTADQLSRVLLDTDKMFAGQMRQPRLTSRGVVEIGSAETDKADADKVEYQK